MAVECYETAGETLDSKKSAEITVCPGEFLNHAASRQSFPLDILRANFLRQDGLFPSRMKKERQRPAKVIHFKWGSLPVDALNRQTMRELHAVARREGITIEQVMSKALDWCLTTRL